MVQSFPLPAEHGELITSRDNRWLKRFRAALRGTGPGEGESLGVEGRTLVQDALRSAVECEAILVSASAESTFKEILDVASATETGISRSRILRTTDKLFESVSGTDTPQGVAALFQAPGWQFEDTLFGVASEDGTFSGTSPLVIVMAGVQDPGNVGTIVRSGEAFGATGAVAARGTADPWSPKALRASAGSALRLPVLRGISIPVLLAQLKIAKVNVIATIGREAGSSAAAAAGTKARVPDLREPCAIFIGSEGAGLSNEVIHSADGKISIPMRSAVESLNAGVAGSIALFEAFRQRGATA